MPSPPFGWLVAQSDENARSFTLYAASTEQLMNRGRLEWPPRQPLLGPGAMGTALQARGLPLGVGSERWNRENPEAVRATHAAYAVAGAGWIVANTFGGNSVRLKGALPNERPAVINRAAVRLAREAAPELPLLASLGPTGASTSAEWEEAYTEQAAALAEAGVEGFLAETIIRLEEGLAAVRAAVRTGVGPVVASYTPGADGCMLDGSTPEAAAEAWVRAGAAAVGVNCGSGPESLLQPARRLVRTHLAPVYAAPSAGLPDLRAGRAYYALAPDAFAEAAIRFRDAGVLLLAGCCGVGPEHVRAAVQRLRDDGKAPR